MILRVNGSYLDFSDAVEVERQIKLFEDISTTNGDYSYSFSIPKTSNNTAILNNPFPDSSTKTVYTQLQAQLLSDDGVTLYEGYIRVERITDVYEVSFFSGNNNWFGMLSGPLTDIDWSDLDVDQTEANIIAADGATDGVVFPVLDNGVLVTRGYRNLIIEDFVAGIYVKTVISRIFRHHSIKVQGELFQEPLYNKLITLRNGKSQEEIDSLSVYAEKTTTTARPGENVQYKLTFQNDSVYPYYNGTGGAFDLTTSTFTAPARMRILLEASFVPSIVDASYNNRIYVYINGAWTFVDIGLDVGGLYNAPTAGDQPEFTINRTLILEQGDTLELYGEWQQSTGSTQNDVLSGWIKITPEYIYRAYGSAIIPPWTQGEYVSNIFKLFNVLPSYEPISKILTLNIFDRIKDKPAIDISEYISGVEVDYVDFISNYGKRNIFSYKEVDFDDLRDYNIQNFFKYGQGAIECDNEFLEDSVDVLESDFSNPQAYINPVFDMSMERTNLVTVEEDTDSFAVIGVADSSGSALFTTLVNNLFVGDLVRITSENVKYNGDWIVSTKSASYVVGSETRVDMEFQGLGYDSNVTKGVLTVLTPRFNESDDVYLLVQVPAYSVPDLSGNPNVFLNTTALTEIGYAYFNLLDTGNQINQDYKQSLSFGEINSPFFYQKTMLDTYWTMFARMLADPVKLFVTAYLPRLVFLDIDFLQPVSITTNETSNRYYLNRISGYDQGDCQIETIKLP